MMFKVTVGLQNFGKIWSLYKARRNLELFDLILNRAGWQRISEVGGKMKTGDIVLMSPITESRYAVQVKSKANRIDFEKYQRRFEDQGFAGCYFVVHSPTPDLNNIQAETIENDGLLKLWLPADVARLSVQYGLAKWIIDKAK